MKQYNLPQNASIEDVGNAFEKSILKAEGNPIQVRKVLDNFKIIHRIRPEQVINNTKDVVDWFKEYLRVGPKLAPPTTGISSTAIQTQTPVQPDIFGKVPPAAVVPPAQTSMLDVTGQGPATGAENQMALDKIYQAKMAGTTVPPSPLDQVAIAQQLKQQMG